MKDLSKEHVLAVLASLLAMGCNKSGEQPKPEPPPAAATANTATSAADKNAPSGASSVGAKEVPKATGDAGTKDNEQSCAPGGCAPGQCGANK